MSDEQNALGTSLTKALASRSQRSILRRLPDPDHALSSGSSSSTLIDFTSNDYLSLSTSPILRTRFLKALSEAPNVLGSGGSRLLVNGRAHTRLEERLANFFGSKAALLFNSGFDANVGFFSCVPQVGDVIVHDEYVHASVHDGMKASRVKPADVLPFQHNSMDDFRRVIERSIALKPDLANGKYSVFIAVESLYSMDGTFAPLQEMVELLDELLPLKNAYLIVDEAHSTGIYGPLGRGRVAMLGLEDRVFARLHTFGKALAATGAVILTNVLVRDYLLNYARSLIYTTSLSYANIIAANCSFDLLIDGTAQGLSNDVLNLSSYFTNKLRLLLSSRNVPPDILSLPFHINCITPEKSGASPIIPVLTPHPRPLSAYLFSLGMNARPITWPTVPKGKDRVRVCLHAGNSQEEVDRLVSAIVRWAEAFPAGMEDSDNRQMAASKFQCKL